MKNGIFRHNTVEEVMRDLEEAKNDLAKNIYERGEYIKCIEENQTLLETMRRDGKHHGLEIDNQEMHIRTLRDRLAMVEHVIRFYERFIKKVSEALNTL